jgi:hypothetical protein
VNFFTVSGIAAQRVSPAASFRTAIFIALFQDHQDEEPDQEADDRAPFEQLREARVIVDVYSHVLRRRIGEQRLFFGHHLPLLMFERLPASITRQSALPNPR